MQNFKPFVFNNCKLAFKIFPLLICGFLFVCCQVKHTASIFPPENQVVSESALNINTVSARELEKLPHVGAITARKIVDFREQYGRFRRPEHLLLIDGVSDKRFREIKNLVKVE